MHDLPRGYFITNPEAKVKLEDQSKDGPNSFEYQNRSKCPPCQNRKKRQSKETMINANTKQIITVTKILKFWCFGNQTVGTSFRKE